MSNFNEALISLERFSESRDLDILLQYRKSSFLEDWHENSHIDWEKNLAHLINSSENVIQLINGELDFFERNLRTKDFWLSSPLLIDMANFDCPTSELIEEEQPEYPITKFDKLGKEWKINTRSQREFFQQFVNHQSQYVKLRNFQNGVKELAAYYLSHKDSPPFNPVYISQPKIPIFGGTNRTAGLLYLLLKHRFFLVNDRQAQTKISEKYQAEIAKEIKSKTISKKEFSQIIASNFYTLKVTKDKATQKDKIEENAILSSTLEKNLTVEVLKTVLDDDLEELIVSFREMADQLEKLKTEKLKNDIRTKK